MSLASNGRASPSTSGLHSNWPANSSQDPFQNASTGSGASRRILPSPVLKQESEKARNVRLLLAKHQEQVNQLLQLRVAQDPHAGPTRNSSMELPVRDLPFKESIVEDENDDDEDEDDLQFLSARLPGNSFPATSPLMAATSMVDSVDTDDDSDDSTLEDKELLKRLKQGQSRMEQIKRMLVTQRGFIVESLRKLAQSHSEFESKKDPDQSCQNCSQGKLVHPDHQASMEQDRTLGRTFVDYNGYDKRQVSEAEMDPASGRLCPMCEAIFPNATSNEDFELHVMEHFSFEESETLVYNPHDST